MAASFFNAEFSAVLDGYILIEPGGIIVGIKKWCLIMACLTMVAAGGTFVFPAYAISSTQVISEGTLLPDIKLKTALTSEMMNYLGLENGTDFTLREISAQIIVIEVFSALCKECHKNVPHVNKLFTIISNDSDLNNSVKMLGVAAGNDDRLVDAYKKTYKVKFPVVADPVEEINQQLGYATTPSIIIANSKGKVLYYHEGVMGDMDHILHVIRSFHVQ